MRLCCKGCERQFKASPKKFIEILDKAVADTQRKDYPLGGIPVEYKGATVPPPDQRRSYS